MSTLSIQKAAGQDKQLSIKACTMKWWLVLLMVVAELVSGEDAFFFASKHVVYENKLENYFLESMDNTFTSVALDTAHSPPNAIRWDCNNFDYFSLDFSLPRVALSRYIRIEQYLAMEIYITFDARSVNDTFASVMRSLTKVGMYQYLDLESLLPLSPEASSSTPLARKWARILFHNTVPQAQQPLRSKNLPLWQLFAVRSRPPVKQPVKDTFFVKQTADLPPAIAIQAWVKTSPLVYFDDFRLITAQIDVFLYKFLSFDLFWGQEGVGANKWKFASSLLLPFSVTGTVPELSTMAFLIPNQTVCFHLTDTTTSLALHRIDTLNLVFASFYGKIIPVPSLADVSKIQLAVMHGGIVVGYATVNSTALVNVIQQLNAQAATTVTIGQVATNTLQLQLSWFTLQRVRLFNGDWLSDRFDSFCLVNNDSPSVSSSSSSSSSTAAAAEEEVEYDKTGCSSPADPVIVQQIQEVISKGQQQAKNQTAEPHVDTSLATSNFFVLTTVFLLQRWERDPPPLPLCAPPPPPTPIPPTPTPTPVLSSLSSSPAEFGNATGNVTGNTGDPWDLLIPLAPAVVVIAPTPIVPDKSALAYVRTASVKQSTETTYLGLEASVFFPVCAGGVALLLIMWLLVARYGQNWLNIDLQNPGRSEILAERSGMAAGGGGGGKEEKDEEKLQLMMTGGGQAMATDHVKVNIKSYDAASDDEAGEGGGRGGERTGGPQLEHLNVKRPSITNKRRSSFKKPFVSGASMMTPEKMAENAQRVRAARVAAAQEDASACNSEEDDGNGLAGVDSDDSFERRGSGKWLGPSEDVIASFYQSKPHNNSNNSNNNKAPMMPQSASLPISPVNAEAETTIDFWKAYNRLRRASKSTDMSFDKLEPKIINATIVTEPHPPTPSGSRRGTGTNALSQLSFPPSFSPALAVTAASAPPVLAPVKKVKKSACKFHGKKSKEKKRGSGKWLGPSDDSIARFYANNQNGVAVDPPYPNGAVDSPPLPPLTPTLPPLPSSLPSSMPSSFPSFLFLPSSTSIAENFPPPPPLPLMAVVQKQQPMNGIHEITPKRDGHSHADGASTHPTTNSTTPFMSNQDIGRASVSYSIQPKYDVMDQPSLIENDCFEDDRFEDGSSSQNSSSKKLGKLGKKMKSRVGGGSKANSKNKASREETMRTSHFRSSLNRGAIPKEL